MGRLILLLLFYLILLLENGAGLDLTLWELGDGFEIRVSLVFKVVFLIINFLILLHFHRTHTIPIFLILTAVFLLLSTGYVIWIDPSSFLQALSVNLHILLMLNIILYIKWNVYEVDQIHKFLAGLRLFALVNAILVIISYFLPTGWDVFETGLSKSGVYRAFGIMGDEVSTFLIFFLYDALISRKWMFLGIFSLAIFLTAGIGASFTTLALLVYHLVFVMKKTRDNLYMTGLISLILIPLIWINFQFISSSSVVDRIKYNLENVQGESAGLRLLSLDVAFDMIRERPLLGYGFGNYRNAVIREFEPKFSEADQLNFFRGSASVILTSAFNPFVQMLAETGLIGLILFIWFLVQLIRSLRPVSPDADEVLIRFNLTSKAWMIVFFITTLSANWFLPSSFLLLLVVSIAGINHSIKSLSLAKIT